MKTKTLLTVGVVAVLGALAYNYYKKKNTTSGYSNANGSTSKTASGGCRVCRGASSDYYAVYGQCRRGDGCKDKVMTTN
jgi:uncharacterized membrane protein YebE (DUF533 family)